MDMKSFSICFFFWVSLFMHSMTQAQTRLLADKPPMGWNSFNSYGVYCYEAAAFANLEAMNTKLKPYGYVYFVIDNGWVGNMSWRRILIFLLSGMHRIFISMNMGCLNLQEHTFRMALRVSSTVVMPKG